MIFLVNDLISYKYDVNWIEVFGERIILQMPNSMKLDENDLESEKEEITYLMLFKDFNRIDLKLIEVKNKELYKDSLNKILLDKDNLFDSGIVPNEDDYLIKKPSQKNLMTVVMNFG